MLKQLDCALQGLNSLLDCCSDDGPLIWGWAGGGTGRGALPRVVSYDPYRKLLAAETFTA